MQTPEAAEQRRSRRRRATFLQDVFANLIYFNGSNIPTRQINLIHSSSESTR